MIPKIIHNIWIQGYDKLSEEIKKNHLLVKKSNHDWEFMIWDNVAILKLLKKYPVLLNIYKNTQKYMDLSNQTTVSQMKKDKMNIKANLAKYVILKEYGGVYYDIDIKCSFDFNQLFSVSRLDASYVEFLKFPSL